VNRLEILFYYLALLFGLIGFVKDSFATERMRLEFAEKGYTYQARFTELETCKLSSLVNDDITGADIGDASLKFYNSSDVELVAGTQAELDANCTATKLTWEPVYNMELIGGSARILTTPINDMYVHVRGVPDLTPAQGGSKDMVCGANLKFLLAKDDIIFDGRASKPMAYNATYHTNKMLVKFSGSVGEKVRLMIKWEHYKQ
jgi:hypothetical protein